MCFDQAETRFDVGGSRWGWVVRLAHRHDPTRTPSHRRRRRGLRRPRRIGRPMLGSMSLNSDGRSWKSTARAPTQATVHTTRSACPQCTCCSRLRRRPGPGPAESRHAARWCIGRRAHGRIHPARRCQAGCSLLRGGWPMVLFWAWTQSPLKVTCHWQRAA